MHQHEWIRLLKTDPLQAVKKLLLLEVNCSNGYANTPTVVVRNAIPGLTSTKNSKLLGYLDEGLCEWFQQMQTQTIPVNVETYLFVSRCWEAIRLAQAFHLPKTFNELLEYEENYLEWFGRIPNMDFIRSPLQGYVKLMKQIKGN